MQKLSLGDWAAVAELIATVGVVISLLFVAYSINRNTDATYGETENLIFERHAELANQFMVDPTLAEILVKMRSEDPQLTPVEAVRWEKYQLNLLDIWAMAYGRHLTDLLGDEQWNAWDEYFIRIFSQGAEQISRERWKELEYGYYDRFWLHVDSALFGK